MAEFIVGFEGLIALAAAALALVWLLLPFAVFGIKRRLDRMIDNQEALLSRLETAGTISPEPPEPSADQDNRHGIKSPDFTRDRPWQS